jgi:hypothetical protein
VTNTDGVLNLSGCVLVSTDSDTVNSTGASGSVSISHSSISGKVSATEGTLFVSDSSFAESTPMLKVASNATLVVGSGNTFNYTETRAYREVL